MAQSARRFVKRHRGHAFGEGGHCRPRRRTSPVTGRAGRFRQTRFEVDRMEGPGQRRGWVSHLRHPHLNSVSNGTVLIWAARGYWHDSHRRRATLRPCRSKPASDVRTRPPCGTLAVFPDWDAQARADHRLRWVSFVASERVIRAGAGVTAVGETVGHGGKGQAVGDAAGLGVAVAQCVRPGLASASQPLADCALPY